MIEELIESNQEWKMYQSRYPPIKTSEDFLKAKEDGLFHSIYGAILEIDVYKNFSRGWLWGDFSKEADWDIDKVNFATCYLPDSARVYDFIIMVAKLMQGRKGETDLKYIWHHTIPYETLGH